MNAIAASSVIPWLRYRNAFVAIDWLKSAFGFEAELIHAEGNLVHHARLACGNGMVLLGSADDGSEWDRHLLQPDETGGRETQSCWVVVDDVDAHFAHAVQAGAEVVIPLADQPYGGRGYACRDIEGHLWWFGDQHPLQSQPLPLTQSRAARRYHH